MVEVVGGWRGDVAWPLVMGLTAMLAVSLARRPAVVAGAVTASAAAFALGARRHLPAVLDAVVEGPAWFTAAAVAAGAIMAIGFHALLRSGRGPEGLALGGVAVGAAAAALPDVEVLLGLCALWLPWVLVAGDPQAEGRPGAARADALASVAVGLLVIFALVDGARGRPGSLLITPVVVGPVVLASICPPPRHLWSMVMRLAVVGSAGLLVARHAGLTSSTVRPLAGSLLATALLAVAALVWRRTVRPAGRT